MGETVGCFPSLEVYMVPSGPWKLFFKKEKSLSVPIQGTLLSVSEVNGVSAMGYIFYLCREIKGNSNSLEYWGKLEDNTDQQHKMIFHFRSLGFFSWPLVFGGSTISPVKEISFKLLIYVYKHTCIYYRLFLGKQIMIPYDFFSDILTII